MIGLKFSLKPFRMLSTISRQEIVCRDVCVDDETNENSSSKKLKDGSQDGWLDLWTSRTQTSSALTPLHTYLEQPKTYTEVKIGGHKLDHHRMFWTSSFSNTMGIEGKKSGLSFRQYPAFFYSKAHCCVYSPTKVGGHALDHVRFIGRGTPSRPLLMPSSYEFKLYRHLRHSDGVCTHCFRDRRILTTTLCQHRFCRDCIFDTLCFNEDKKEFTFSCPQCKLMQIINLNIPQQNALPSPNHPVKISSTTKAIVFAVGFHTVPRILTQLYNWKKIETKKVARNPQETKQDQEQDNRNTRSSLSSSSSSDNSMHDKDRWDHFLTSVKDYSTLHQYSFVRRLGSGNFAHAFLMKRNGCLCVLKESDKLVEAMNEIKLLSKVQHSHVVKLQDFFIEEIGHRNVAYLELEYCNAGDLRKRIVEQGSMKAHQVVDILLQICSGLEALHSYRIIHRDLKPENILLTQEDQVKVADFGISTLIDWNLSGLHHAAGSLEYMAPEVRQFLLGKSITYDERADIWAIGALAVAMISGNPEPSIALRPLHEVMTSLKKYGCNHQLLSAIKAALHPLPAERISLRKLVQLLAASSNQSRL